MAQQPTKMNALELLDRSSQTGVDPVIILPSISSAPSSTTSKLYNLNGVLYFDGQNLENSAGGGDDTLDNAYTNGRDITLDSGDISLSDSTTGAENMLTFTKTGAGSGNLIDISVDAALTGNAIAIDMNLGIAAPAIFIDNGATARTGADLLVTADSTGAHSVIDINDSGSGATVGFDFTGSYNGSPGGQAIKVTFDANDALDTEVMQVDTGAGNRGAMFDFNFGHSDSGTTSHIFDIDISGVLDSNVLDVAFSAAATGNVININMDTAVAGTALHIEGSGVRTQPFVELSTDATGSAHLVDIDVSGAISGDIFNIALSTTSTGSVMDVDMDAAVGAALFTIDAGGGTRTADLIDITFDGDGNVGIIDANVTNTGSGALLDFDITGIHTGNILDITYGTAASTGNAIDLNMGTNVAGMAISVASAATGTSGEGSALDVSHTGDLGAGADVVRIHSTGSPSATSNLVSIEQDTGAGTAGAYALYVSATGTNVEGIKVDAGDVVFDEDMTVSGRVIEDGTTTTSGAGAVAVTGSIHEVTTTGTGDALTLADGAEGQRLVVVYAAEGAGGDTAVITPTNLAGGTTITLNNLGDTADLIFTAGEWYVLGLGGAAAVA